MNYGKKGAKKRQKTLTSKTAKLGKMFGVTFFKALLICIVAVGIIGLCAGVGLFKGILDSAPDISTLDVRPSGYSSVVYDSAGNQTTKLIAQNSNRAYQTMDKIPVDLQHAFVAIEDERFYDHNGIDIKGIIRAGIIGITSGKFSEGASTITQQLLKNNVFTGWTSESSFAEKVKRKIQEQYLAVELEKVMDKETILEYYMNTINLGQNTLGVQTASLRYFNKPVSEINLSEAAVIAAITQNPSRLNPISHPENNKERRNKVLRNMLDQGYITQAAFDEAMNDDVYSRIQTVNEETESTTIYSYFVDELTNQIMTDLKEKGGYTDTQAYNLLYSSGLSIYTTQDPQIQEICDRVTADPANYPETVKWLLDYKLSTKTASGETKNYSSEMFQTYFKQTNSNFRMLYDDEASAQAAVAEYKAAVLAPGEEVIAEDMHLTPQPQISVTVIDQSTGYVKAVVGGRGKKEASLTLNRATDTRRQPGSTFKVVSTYAPALDSAGKTLASVEVDAPFNYANGRPVSNWYGSAYKGICTLRYGIEQSLNIVTVKCLTDITPQLGFDYLKNFGFTTLVDREVRADGTIVSDITQSLALGGITYGVKNVELNAAYAAIANGGTYIKPVYYTKILDHDGNILLENEPESRQVIKPATAFLLTDAMVDVVTKGTGGSVNFGNMAIAGKTGTTSDYNDVWFSGYTPYYTCTTWAGYDNNTKLSTPVEKALAKKIWRGVMEEIHQGLEYKSFTTPEGITNATVCNKSGKLSVDGLCTLDGSAHNEYFIAGTEPVEVCDCHVVGPVCAATGLRAGATCPFSTQGIFITSPEGEGGEGGTGWCPHTVLDGLPFGSGDITLPGSITPDAMGDMNQPGGVTPNTGEAANPLGIPTNP
ncbi:PBP1A family penicillin-binding protein [bacterium C-53]|nr:PBP1A family penicillin-binding protein [Lachnospiraceae bacterium]NBI02517.1 PBP1A family penicillin-binding protein [Lachnospiraceae bacterium]RKJ11609.1 PBP1A family penicillin-binding protein [bacterium C-53]